MEKQEFNTMEACAASALDFIDTVLLCMKEDGFKDDVIDDYRKYLLTIHDMHYNTDIGEQGENITNYLDEYKLSFLQEEGNKIEKQLIETGFAKCIGASFEPVNGHQGRVMDFEFNGNIKDLDEITLLDKLSKWVVSRDLGVNVDKYDDEEHRNMFSVTIWFLDIRREIM